MPSTHPAPPRIGLYPGTFDPITLGHGDIILRASKMVDQLVVGVAENAGKGPLFALPERVAMVREEVAALESPKNPASPCQITVQPFNNLLIAFAKEINASVILRGLRAVSDFEYEFQMAAMNRKLAPQLETLFLMASDKYQFISSRFVKEIARLGGAVDPFVSPRILARIVQKMPMPE